MADARTCMCRRRVISGLCSGAVAFVCTSSGASHWFRTFRAKLPLYFAMMERYLSCPSTPLRTLGRQVLLHQPRASNPRIAVGVRPLYNSFRFGAFACALFSFPRTSAAIRRKATRFGLLERNRFCAVSRSASAGDSAPQERLRPSYMQQVEKGEQQLLAVAVLASALFMAFWVFWSPGSVWIGSSPEHDRLGVEDWSLSGADVIAPASLIYKYSVMGQVAGLTHALPGVVWALLAPLQLNPAARRSFDGGLHSLAGRLMLAAAGVLMIGFVIIDEQQISAEMIDFSGNGGDLARMLDSMSSTLFGNTLPPFNVLSLRALAVWFVYTGVQTWLTASPRPQDIREHRKWALRHIAAGLWVAAQRVFFIVFRLAQVALLGEMAGKSAEPMGAAFYYAGYLATALYMLSAEMAIDAGEPPREPAVAAAAAAAAMSPPGVSAKTSSGKAK